MNFEIEDNLPHPLTGSCDDLLDNGSSRNRITNVFVGNNLESVFFFYKFR
jgi:hypothetical protein